MTYRIDVVVNNSGYDLTGAIEEISFDDMRAQFETNFFGAVKVMKAVIPLSLLSIFGFFIKLILEKN